MAVAAPQGPPYYAFIDECRGQAGIPNRPGDIYFGIAPGAAIPQEVLDLQDRLEFTARTLRELYQQNDVNRFNQHFSQLLSAAQLLAGPTPNPLVVARALSRIHEDVLAREGRRMKTTHLNKLGSRLGLVVIAIVALIVLSQTGSNSYVNWAPMERFTPFYGAAFIAAAVGMWLSFATRKPRLTFEDLLEPEGDMMGPGHRIAYVLLFTAVLALLAAGNVMGVSVGEFSTEKIATSYISAAIFGFMCGFSEKLLAATVAPHVSFFLQGFGKVKGTA